MELLRRKIEEDAVDEVECVGFDARVLDDDEDLELAAVTPPLPPAEPEAATPKSTQSSTTELSSSNKSNGGGAVTLQVSGMSCAVGTGRVERAILAVRGVDKASVSLPTGRATVTFTPYKADDDDGEDEMMFQDDEKLTSAAQDIGGSSGYDSDKQRAESLAESCERDQLAS